jgi:hypothetical protein
MEHFDPFLSEMEIRRRMEEARQWAANERLARQARAGQPSLASRIGVAVKRVTMPLRRLSGWRRIADNGSDTRTSVPKRISDAIVSGGGHEHC